LPQPICRFFLASCGGRNGETEAKNDMTMEIAPRIELKDFFKNPEKTSYQISPEGK
jgi:hypothetical protein